MKVFKDIRFYLGAGLLIALVSIMWSMPMTADAAPDKAGDKATEKAADAATTTPGHIFDRDDTVAEKKRKVEEKNRKQRERRRKLEEYLRGKYKIDNDLPGGGSGISLRFARDGYLKGLTLRGEFIPPGLAKKEGATDDDLRAAALAFLNEERDIFGINNAAKDLTEVEFHTNPSNKVSGIQYRRYLEGLIFKGYAIRLVLREDGTVITVYAGLPILTPELLAAAKKFKAEGLDWEATREFIKADLVKRGADREVVDRADFPKHIFLSQEEPYVRVHVRVSPPRDTFGRPSDFGQWLYMFNAITGEFLKRASMLVN